MSCSARRRRRWCYSTLYSIEIMFEVMSSVVVGAAPREFGDFSARYLRLSTAAYPPPPPPPPRIQSGGETYARDTYLNICSIDYPEKVKPRVRTTVCTFSFTCFFSFRHLVNVQNYRMCIMMFTKKNVKNKKNNNKHV